MSTDNAEVFGNSIADIFRVHAVNIAAIGLSLTELETCLRVASILAALIYTICKTIQSILDIRAKAKERSESELN